MTATQLAVRESPPLIGACPKLWCIARNGCYEDDPGGLRYHAGRESSVRADQGATIDVTPLQFDEQDNSTYSGPLVNIRLDGCKQVELDLSAATGLGFAEVLAHFAAGDAPVGAEATFGGQHGQREPNGTITVRRIEDITYVYGSAGERTFTLGGIDIAIHNSDGDPQDFRLNIDSANAACFARYVVAAVVEVTQ